MAHKTFYYARVFDDETHLDGILEAFQAYGAQAQEIFIDSGTDCVPGEARAWLRVETALQAEDTLVVPSLARLGGKKAEVQRALQGLTDRHIRLKVLDLPATLAELPEDGQWAAELMNRLLLEAFSAMVMRQEQFSRARQRQGIAASKAAGVRFGRPRIEKQAAFYRLRDRWQTGEISTREAARLLGVSHQTFWKWVKGA